MKELIIEYIRRYAKAQPVAAVGEIIDKLADGVARIKEPPTKRAMVQVPFLYKGNVTRPVWICACCRNIVSGTDKFCHECGRRFSE